MGAALLVYTARAALGIGAGASLIMIAYTIAKVAGHPITDTGFGDAALSIWATSFAVWFGCLLVAWIADRKRNL